MSLNTHCRANRKYQVLAAVCLAGLCMPLSFTGPALALRAIGAELGASASGLNWVGNAFMLGFGASLMAAGALADAYGRKRLFMLGLALFCALSLALSAAPDIVWLDLLRALQGCACAAAFSGGVAALAQEFDGHARDRAFSALGTSFGVGLAFGPLLAGQLIAAAGWRALFFASAALGALALLLGAARMRESRDALAGGVDWPGALSFSAALALLTLGLLRGPDSGWGDATTLAALAAAALLGAAFVAIERRVARPMLDLSLFRLPAFAGVQLLAAAPAYSYVVLLVLLPMRFIGIEGHGEIEAGRMMIALSAPMLVLPFLAATASRKIAPGLIAATGLLLAAAGLLCLSQCAPGAAAGAPTASLLLIGVGVSLPWGLMDGLAVAVVPAERAGMAAGIFNTTRVAGEGIALAVVAALLAALIRHALGQALAGLELPADRLDAAARRLATGDLARAMALLPQAGRASLIQAYADATRLLLYILAAITTLSALVIFHFLGRPAPQAAPAPRSRRAPAASPAPR